MWVAAAVRRFHGPEHDFAPSGGKKVPPGAQSDPSGSIWHPKIHQNPVKMCPPGEFFVKRPICNPLAPAQSKHCLWHVILSTFRPQCGPGGPQKSLCKKIIQNMNILCALGSFWVPRVLPKAPLGDHFTIIFGTFCMTWADHPSRLVQTSSFNQKATLHTYKSTVLKPKWSSWYPSHQADKLKNWA